MTYQYKIGIVGPSRIGKTTLMTSILNETKDIMMQTKLSIQAKNGPTRTKLDDCRANLKGIIAPGAEFRPDSLPGNASDFVYTLDMNLQGKSLIEFAFKDFPGGWLSNDTDDWDQKVRPWINDSSVLLVPIDASVIMEATLARHKQKIPGLLETVNVVDVVDEWAKSRSDRGVDKPAMLVLAPLKCESYFSDNVNKGNVDKSSTLENEIRGARGYYKDIIDKIGFYNSQRKTPIKLWYCPIDTLGCVELSKKKWTDDGLQPTFTCTTIAPQMTPRGAADVLNLLCQHFIQDVANCKMNQNMINIFLQFLGNLFRGESPVVIQDLVDCLNVLSNTTLKRAKQWI